jgi:ketosteroid isomerase-like protein
MTSTPTWRLTAHPALEWHPAIAQSVEGPGTVYRGVAGVRQFWKDSHEVFELGFGETEIRDLGDKLLALSQVSVAGRASGVDLEAPLAMVMTLENGLVVRADQYLSHAEALEAVGLSE